MDNIKMLDLEEQYSNLKNEIIPALENVMESSNFILGENVSKIEKNIAKYSRTNYGVGVANGSDAIHIALQAAGVKEGDEVITTPFTFFATAGAIIRANAKPIFVDINPYTYNIDVNKIEAALTNKTKAIVPVHLYGQMSEIKEIKRIADINNIEIIEDAAQAIGAKANDISVGELSTAATYSFFPTKNLGAYGDGGMIVTNNADIAEASRVIRVHGSKPKYYHHVLGYNSRLDELQAAILNVKFPQLNVYSEARRQRAQYYTKKLQASVSNFVSTPYEINGYYHVYHQYTIRVQRRDELQDFLKENGIASMVYYPVPLHLQPVFNDLGYKKGDFPITEQASQEVLSLPMWPELKEEQQDYVIDKIIKFYNA